MLKWAETESTVEGNLQDEVPFTHGNFESLSFVEAPDCIDSDVYLQQTAPRNPLNEDNSSKTPKLGHSSTSASEEDDVSALYLRCSPTCEIVSEVYHQEVDPESSDPSTENEKKDLEKRCALFSMVEADTHDHSITPSLTKLPRITLHVNRPQHKPIPKIILRVGQSKGTRVPKVSHCYKDQTHKTKKRKIM